MSLSPVEAFLLSDNYLPYTTYAHARRTHVTSVSSAPPIRTSCRLYLLGICSVGMSDLLTQFDIVDRAEQARRRSGGSDEAILGGGGGGVRDSLNPFDDQELQSPVAAMQVSSNFCKVGLGVVAVVKELATGDGYKKPIILLQ